MITEAIMKKTFLKRIISSALALVAATTFISCGTGGKNNSSKKDDPTKTKLTIFNYKAGYGDEWLLRLCDSFEKQYADYSFEPGKKGVSIVEPKGDMRTFTTAQMRESSYNIFFLENAPYYNYLDGTLEDLTSIVEGKADESDALTVGEKLDEQQVDYYGVKADGKTHYYGLPSYIGNYGIIYNIDLFDKKGYYLAADRTNGVIIGSDKNAKRTDGPDGKPGTADDGLPATYDEFFDLCAEISSNNDTPICWPGKHRQHHLGNLMDSLVSDYEGVEQMRLNYTFKGEAEDLVVIENGNVKRNADGTPVTEKKEINPSNGYDIARQAGNLYGMEFIEKLMSNRRYYNNDAFTDSFTHTDNQELFLMNGTDLSETDKTTAMLVDGPWWMEESAGVFEEMAEADEKYSEKNRRFGWMPLPKATKEKVGKGNVFSDYLNAFVCVKSGLPEGVKNAALEFVKYSCSDKMLRDFTRTTGTVKGYKYDMTTEDMKGLSEFSKSLISAVKNSDIVYKYSSSSFYNANITYLAYDVVYTATVKGSTYKNVIDGIREGGTTGEGYFKSFVEYFSKYSFWNA